VASIAVFILAIKFVDFQVTNPDIQTQISSTQTSPLYQRVVPIDLSSLSFSGTDNVDTNIKANVEFLLDEQGLSAQWGAVDQAKQYHFSLSNNSQGQKPVFAQDTNGTSILLNKDLLVSNSDYRWRLDVTLEDGSLMRTEGSVRLSAEHQ